MTDNEKEQIRQLRLQGNGPRTIARIMGISENTIKTFCRRQRIECTEIIPRIIDEPESEAPRCKYCDEPLIRYEGRKKKMFCSDRCRMAWWNTHQDQVKKKAMYEFECSFCHKPFTAYGNSHRKYCSHDCYINDRFGGV